MCIISSEGFLKSAQNLTLAVSEILGWVKSLAVVHNTLMVTHSLIQAVIYVLTRLSVLDSLHWSPTLLLNPFLPRLTMLACWPEHATVYDREQAVFSCFHSGFVKVTHCH